MCPTCLGILEQTATGLGKGYLGRVDAFFEATRRHVKSYFFHRNVYVVKPNSNT